LTRVELVMEARAVYVRVGGLSVFLAWVCALTLGMAVWALALAALIVVAFFALLRPSVRREIGKGWRGEPPYDS
jgi:hypothetical protein